MSLVDENDYKNIIITFQIAFVVSVFARFYSQRFLPVRRFQNNTQRKEIWIDEEVLGKCCTIPKIKSCEIWKIQTCYLYRKNRFLTFKPIVI